MIPRVPDPDATDDIAPQDYTVEQVRDDLIDIILRNPDTRNPTTGSDGSGKCVYRKDMLGEATERCLIGTWLHERGHNYDPTWDARLTSASSIAQTLGYPDEVGSVLSHAQGKADVNRPAWRTLLNLNLGV